MQIQIEVAEQFASRPALREVAGRMIRDAFAVTYPQQLIDPEVAVVASTRNAPAGRGTLVVSLTDALMTCFADQAAPGWVAGQAALYFDRALVGVTPLDIDVVQLSADIERLSFGLLDEYAQAIADYWSAPATTQASRWQWLAQRLKQDLVEDLRSPHSHGLDVASRDALHTVSMFTDRSQRDFMLNLTPPGQERLTLTAGILHLRVSSSGVAASMPFPAIVLRHSQGDRHQVTAWRPNGDVHRAGNLEDLVAAICADMTGQWAFDQFDWTFQESSANVFHDVTQAILGRQLSDILAVQGALAYELPELEQYLRAATDICAWLQPSAPTPRLDPSRLPVWLRSAPAADKLVFCRGLDVLAQAQLTAGGQAFNDDLPPITDFTEQALTREMRRDHPDDEQPAVTEIEVVIDKTVGAAIASGGQMIASGTVEPVSMTFVEFALYNLCSLPAGKRSVRNATGGDLPGWLTPDYLQELVTRVDIGSVYPQRIKHYLIDDPAEVARRRQLFADQLRVQLPLKALEQKLKGEGRMSAPGCNAVAALLADASDGQGMKGTSIVLRPLSFVREPGKPVDRVANMFIIGPTDMSVAPCVLFRPFSPIPFAEFAGASALLEAIVRPGALQDDVLLWLTDDARAVYANGGFLEPHIVRFGLGSDFAPLERPAPAQLGTAVCVGEPLTELFDANARALVTLADRDSVSNVESRWAIFKEGGWVLLNALLPLIGGAIANAAWLVQLLSSFERFAAATSDRPDARAASGTLAELLLNLSMVLMHQQVAVHALAYRQFTGPRTVRGAGLDHAQINEVTLEAVAPLLDFSWSNPVNQLDGPQRAALQGFRVANVPALQPLAGQGAEAGLYEAQGRLMIQLGTEVYQVQRDEDGYFIVDPADVGRRGPRVSRDGAGWRLDLRLHLRGGGPKKRARELAQHNAQALQRVRETRSTLGRRRDELYRKMDVYNTQLSTAGEEVRALFLARYDTDLKEALDVVRQRGALVQELRPGDRPSERELGADIKDIASRVRYLEAMLFKDITDIAKASVVAMRGEVTGDAVVEENVDAYMDLFNKLVGRQQKGLEWATVRESLWRQLRELPQAGDGYWRAEVLDFERTNLPSLLEWRFMQLFSFLELSFSREDMLRTEAYRPLKDLRVSVKLYDAMSSHAQLERPNSYSLTERTEVLESALREYDRAIEIASFTRESDFMDRRNDYLERFIGELQVLRDATEGQLTALIQENTDPPVRPVERVPHREQPRKKIIRTRDRRVLVAEVRGEPGEAADQVVDVHDVLTHRVINSWHQHADGGWTEVETVEPQPPAHPAAPSAAARADLRQRAHTLLAQVDHAVSSAWRQSTRPVEPEDMEDILTLRAARLTELADSLGATEGDVLITQLRQAAARLVEEGRNLRIAMIKRQPPTAARVSYLHRQGEIDIARVDGRTNISGARRNDFLQEYTLRDKQHQLLWWAHFHYASEEAAPAAFTAAHLKLPEQRTLGYKALVRAAKDNKAVVDIYRSAIGKDVAQRLFLPLAR